MVGQANIINRFGGVKMEDIRGVRVPFLKPGWNRFVLLDILFNYLLLSNLFKFGVQAVSHDEGVRVRLRLVHPGAAVGPADLALHARLQDTAQVHRRQKVPLEVRAVMY